MHCKEALGEREGETYEEKPFCLLGMTKEKKEEGITGRVSQDNAVVDLEEKMKR